MAFRGCRLVAQCSREVWDPSARHYDWLRGASLHGSGGNARDGSTAPDPKSPMVGAPKGARSSAEDAGAPRKRPGPPRDISAFTRVLCDT